MSTRDRYRAFQLIHRRTRTLADTYELTLAVDDLDHIDPRFTIAASRMQDARAGLPGAASYDSPSVSGTGATKLTGPERLASTPDRTQPDRQLLDDLLHGLEKLTAPGQAVTDASEYARTITRTVLTLRRLIDAWTPHRPSAKDLREAGAAASDNDGAWCSHHRTAGYMEPTHRMWDVDGVKLPLCQSCVDQHRRNGKLPTAEWMQRRASRGKNDRERVS